jgi:hypothetical protein
MDFGNAPKLIPLGTGLVVPRSEILATVGGVAVDLPPEKTVQSASAGDAVKLDLRTEQRDRQDQRPADERKARDVGSEQQLRDVVQRRLVIEPRTRSVVLQEKDAKTGETIQTVPDEATLKLRLFARAIADRAREAGDDTARYVERTA